LSKPAGCLARAQKENARPALWIIARRAEKVKQNFTILAIFIFDLFLSLFINDEKHIRRPFSRAVPTGFGIPHFTYLSEKVPEFIYFVPESICNYAPFVQLN
jgi:hypothetical protein